VTPTSGPVSETRALVPGQARGRALVLDEPLSFWGGVDPATGAIIDRHHPQVGRSVAGTILVMPSGRGSSSSSSVLAEAIRSGTGPAGIVLREPDRIVALGALVAAELYGKVCPVLVPAEDAYRGIRPEETLGLGPSGDRWEVTRLTTGDADATSA
jgi:predicted aconitase with swiveling domain